MYFAKLLNFFTVATTATTVLVPLYIWPGAGGPTNWQPLISAVQNYPNVFFTVVINPNSGPGAADFPDTDYIPSVSRLNSFNNVRVLGYVHTTYGQEDLNVLNANTTKYSNWNTFANTPGNANTTIAGIFFDEVEYRDTSKVTYMENAASHARTVLATTNVPKPFVVYNPGTRELIQYFSSNVDLIIQSEVAFADYDPNGTIANFPLGTIPQSAIVIHTAGNAAAVTDATKRAVAQGIGGVYFTADCCYNAIDQTTINAVAGAAN